MRRIIVFSGAGLSADSGIPTFRDSGGLWENHNVEDVAEHEAWFRDKEMVLRFYQERFDNYKVCKPHLGHEALAKLEQKFKVTHITQNIDNLLEQAGCSDVRHLHGQICWKKCEWHKDITILDGDCNFICDFKTNTDESVKLGELCPKCGGQLRPDVVWFNEAVGNMNYDEMKDWCKDVKYNDGIFMSIGTSVQVYPAGYFVSFFSQVKNKFIVDVKPQKVANYELIEGKASEQLPILVDTLMKEEA